VQSNKRTDAYSALTDPLHFLRRIVSAIRAPDVVPDNFILGIKLNAADYAHGASSTDGEDRVLQHVRDIAGWNTVDFIEVSGGNYENPGISVITP
jgi:2,4-dienoyl-CoA reductase-like NADH-dependent reductase (Old Yellow Enzyme family)